MTTLFALIFWGAQLGTPAEAPAVTPVGFASKAECEAMGTDLITKSNAAGSSRNRFLCAPITVGKAH